jgi:hypothetical protein
MFESRVGESYRTRKVVASHAGRGEMLSQQTQ